MRSVVFHGFALHCALILLIAPVSAQDKKDPMFEGKPVSYWIGQLKEKGDASKKAVEALASIGEPAVPALIEALKQGGDFRPGAVTALLAIGPPAKAAIPALIEAFAETERIFLPRVAASAVKKIGEKDAIPQLIEALKHSNEGARRNAAIALGWYEKDAEKAVPILVDLLKEKGRFVRHDAAQSLWRIEKNPKALIVLIVDLKHDIPDTRWNAARILGTLGKDAKEAVPGLVEALRDGDKEVREQAASALKKIDPDAAKKAGVK